MSDPLNEGVAQNALQVVERRYTLDWQALLLPEWNLRRDVADSSSDRSDDYPGEHSHRLASSDH
jgi:hypothetical protein